MADVLKWYGSKEKAMEAIMQSTGNTEEIESKQDENTKIYKQFMAAKKANNMDMAHSAVEMLAKNYKTMFALDNARNILLDLAKEYLQHEKLASAVREARTELGLSQEKLAELLNIDSHTILNIQAGRGNPNFEKLYPLLAYLKIPAGKIFDSNYEDETPNLLQKLLSLQNVSDAIFVS